MFDPNSIPENDPFRNVWSWDIEVLKNCFTLTAVNMVNPDNVKRFVIWKHINQCKEIDEFIRSTAGLIGYNSINFDYPIVHLCLLIRRKAAAMQTGHELATFIYKKTQEILQMEYPPTIKWRDVIVPQRDTYRIWHFDNEAKATSLKWVQCAIRWPSVEESPFQHYDTIETFEQLQKLLDYNLNDCLSNRAFYLQKTLPKVKMRKVLSKKYGLSLENANDAKIGEQIVLSGVAKEKGISLWDLKELRTDRSFVYLKNIILPHIRFQSAEFNYILAKFESMKVVDTWSKEEIKVAFDGMKYVFGMGGIHAARVTAKGKGIVDGGEVFEEIDSCDVSSYYPNLALSFGFFPEHLGQEFAEVYRSIYLERKKYAKGTPENEGLKLALNAVFGKSNSAFSTLNDMQMFLQITINGQLLLAMLCERLTVSGAARVIMANTDGIEVQVKNRPLYEQICKEWEQENRLTLEYSKYKVLAIRDVNNYIAVKYDGTTKEKGAYEVDKEIHKDPSMRVVPLAIREYFKNGTPVSKFINEHKDLWDFFMYVRAKTGEFRLRWVDSETSELMDAPVTKTLRYYAAKKGDVLMKKTEKKFEKVHQRTYTLICNDVKHPNFELMPEMLDRSFYVNEAMKLLDVIHKKPENLFT